MTSTRPAVGSTPAPRLFALSAVAGPALFTFAWLVLGMVSPGYTLFGTYIPYSAVSQPVSGLGLGPTAPYMNTAFVLAGVLLMVGITAALQSTADEGRPAMRLAATGMLALTPVGMVLVGIFDLEAPLAHLAGAMLALASPVISFLIAGSYFRAIPCWRRFGTWLLLGSPLTLLFTVLFSLTFDEARVAAGEGVAGLVQRVWIVEVHAWFAAMGWLAYRRR